MKKKKNKGTENQTEQFHFELQPPRPVFNERGERDYFAEYYRSYKNDYIDQYLKAYRELKNIDAAIKKVDSEVPVKKK